MKDELVKVLEYFHTNGVINKCSNSTFSVLIVKDRFASIKDYRPISLVSSLYKVIAKVHSRRLRMVLQDMVSQAQGAFMVFY